MTRVFVVGSVAGAGMFSVLAAWAQPGRTKTLQSAAATRVASPQTGFGTRSSATVPPSVGSLATTPQTIGTEGGAAVQPLSPPATVPYTAPAPAYQYTSPPVVVSGAS